MHWLFLIDRKWLFLFGSTWLIQPDANRAKVFRTDELGAIIFSLSPSVGVHEGGGVATYLPKNNRGFAEKLFLSY